MLGPFRSGARVLVISLFDGIGGLRRSLERLEVRAPIYFAIEWETAVKRAVRVRWPGVVEAEDIRHVTRQELELVIRQAVLNGCNVCVFGGGFLCQCVSLLNAGRAGIEGNRSSLFRGLCRLAADSQSLCRMAGLNFCGFAECVLMSAADEAAVTRELCWPLFLTCPSGESLSRRPRSF